MICRIAHVGCWIAIALTLLAGPAVAAGPSDGDFEEKSWSEIEAQLPAFPKDEDLIPFRVGAVRDRQFFIDGSSISIGSDDVIRYTVVVVSPAGARNISFEGMRCATGERRVYAFGRSDSTWSKARSNTWTKIRGDSNQYPVALYSDYLCRLGGRSIATPDEARRILRYGR